MLLSLGLRNVALIEELEIQFHKGFHVLSGETGAGKRPGWKPCSTFPGMKAWPRC